MSAAATTIAKADSPSPNAEYEAVNKAVSEWFEKYDQIRRDAEMSMPEKLKYGHSLKKALKSGGRMTPSAKAFAERMRSKYSEAAAAMKALAVVSETKELQEGYVQYFTEMERNFSDCISEEEISTASTEAKSLVKEKIEKLNEKNKKLDEELRSKYAIPKHKHR